MAQVNHLREGPEEGLQPRVGTALWATLPGQPAILPVGQAVSSALSWPRQSSLSKLPAADRESNSQARQPVGTDSGIWAPTQPISVLAGWAGLLCGSSSPSLWLLGAPGSLPDPAVPTRALGREEVR